MKTTQCIIEINPPEKKIDIDYFMRKVIVVRPVFKLLTPLLKVQQFNYLKNENILNKNYLLQHGYAIFR